MEYSFFEKFADNFIFEIVSQTTKNVNPTKLL